MVRDALKELGFTDDNKSIAPLYEDTYAYSIEMRNLYSSRNIKLFIQGSYANNTNVRTKSDVDIAVIQEEVFQTIYRTGVTDENYKFVNSSIPSKSFKDEVQECLENKFGSDVERKNKSIKVNGNTYRKDADAVPCIRYRDYRQDFFNDADNYIGGIVIKSDKGERIINYPEQHISNGKVKNNETNHYYKKMVRIIKKMRYLMEEYCYTSAKKVSSFGLESLLWNIPNDIFTRYSIYRYEFGEIVDYLYSNTNYLYTYKEANGIKPLCPNQTDIDNYKKFIGDLKVFYEYDI
ncbi:Uncharacterised protein [Clostridium paraputrificum]|uniref:Uncharacterized protein n=1 Tax=Clostridium paraputrificum TaxID=29363 RepID=A0A6N2YBA5_9CLOT